MTRVVTEALLAELRNDHAALGELRALLGTVPTVYTSQTLAAELGITPRAVRAAIERGDLEARRSGRGYVIGADAVAAWATPTATARVKHRHRGGKPLRRALAPLDDEAGRQGVERRRPGKEVQPKPARTPPD